MGHLIAEIFTDTHYPDIVVNSVVSAFHIAVDFTNNENFAIVLECHVNVDMTTAVQTAHLITSQQKLTIGSDRLA